jgi:aldose 1-epimerase
LELKIVIFAIKDVEILAVTKTPYGFMPDGKEVFSFNIKNSIISVDILTLGATLDKLLVKDINGVYRDVVLGFDDLSSRLQFSDYHGVTVGRYCNRIKDGRFKLNSKEYTLPKNENGITCLHGNDEYSNAIWECESYDDKSITFTYFSPDMTNGFPANLNNRVIYSITDDGNFIIDFLCIPDAETVINLTNHAYFNLNGIASGTVLNHDFIMNAAYFTPIDQNSIPTGKIASVKGTPFSFIEGKKLGEDIDGDDIQIKNGSGYDHNFCINDYDGTLRTAAVIKGDKSCIKLTIKTTLPGFQLYSGNFLSGAIGKSNYPLDKRTGFCFETQFYPNSPNNPCFPSSVFTPENPYKSTTVFSFSTN